MSVRLIVKHLGPRTTERQLRRLFASAGIDVSAEIPHDRETGRSRGFGFVELRTESEAERALMVFNGRFLGNRELWLERARENGSGGAGKKRGARRERGNGANVSLDSYDHRRGGDYAADRGARKRRRGKHGSDRVRGSGTRRTIE